MEDFVSKLIEEASMKVDAQKQTLIEERVIERVPFIGKLNWVEESSRTFPRIKKVINTDHSEAWYWNDGSQYGLHLITFYPQPLEADLESNTFKIHFQYR